MQIAVNVYLMSCLDCLTHCRTSRRTYITSLIVLLPSEATANVLEGAAFVREFLLSSEYACPQDLTQSCLPQDRQCGSQRYGIGTEQCFSSPNCWQLDSRDSTISFSINSTTVPSSLIDDYGCFEEVANHHRLVNFVCKLNTYRRHHDWWLSMLANCSVTTCRHLQGMDPTIYSPSIDFPYCLARRQ